MKKAWNCVLLSHKKEWCHRNQPLSIQCYDPEAASDYVLPAGSVTSVGFVGKPCFLPCQSLMWSRKEDGKCDGQPGEPLSASQDQEIFRSVCIVCSFANRVRSFRPVMCSWIGLSRLEASRELWARSLSDNMNRELEYMFVDVSLYLVFSQMRLSDHGKAIYNQKKKI